MRREVFAEHFRDAVVASKEIARFIVDERLPSADCFRLRLSRSDHRIPLLADEVLFQESSVDGHDRSSLCGRLEAVLLLWRNGAVPEWVNIRVAGVTRTATVFDIIFSERFTTNGSLLYHRDGGVPPFNVLEPDAPIGREPGRSFSLYERSVCTTQGDLDVLGDHANKVHQLEISGAFLDDETLRSLPALPNLYLIELSGGVIRGPGMAALDKHPRLEWLRMRLERPAEFEIPMIPDLSSLTSIRLENLPSRPWGCERLITHCPNLDSICLRSLGCLFITRVFPRALKSLSLSGTRIDGDTELPERLTDLRIHLDGAAEVDLDLLLRNVERVSHLSLGKTPVSDPFVNRLVARMDNLRTLQVSGVSKELRRHLATQRPNLHIWRGRIP